MILTLSYIFTVLVVLVSVYLLFCYFQNSNLYQEAAKLSGPPTLPLIGNAHRFLGSTQDIFKEVVNQMDSYPSPYRIWLGGQLVYVIYDPDNIKTVLMSPKTIDKVDTYKFVEPWLGTGLITASGAKWRNHRKLIGKTFNQRILNSFVEVFSEKSETLIKDMEVEANGEEFGIVNYVSQCLLDIVTTTIMGISQTENRSAYMHAVHEILGITFSRMFKIWLYPDIIFKFTRSGRHMQNSLKYLHGFTSAIINRKKAAFESNENGRARSGFQTFLDSLMGLRNEGIVLTDEELREEVDIMTVAGYETCAGIVSFALLMMATYPKIQDKVYEELCEIYGNGEPCSSPIKHEDLRRMEYLERVIRETLRLFPSGPILFRRVTDELKMGNCTLLKGTSVVMSLIKMHRSEEYWKDPLAFDPDRFLPEERAKRHPFAYIPFSARPRDCIGLNYAMMVTQTLLAMILRKYVIKKDKAVPIQDIKLKIEFVLKPVEPITIRIKKRIHGKM